MSTSSAHSVEVDVHFHSLLLEDVSITGGKVPLPVWRRPSGHVHGDERAVPHTHLHNFSGMISMGVIRRPWSSPSDNKVDQQVIMLLRNMDKDDPLSGQGKKSDLINVSSDHVIPIPAPLESMAGKSGQDRLQTITALLPSYLTAYAMISPHLDVSAVREMMHNQTAMRISLCIQNNGILLQALQDTISVWNSSVPTKSSGDGIEINIIRDAADVSSLSSKKSKAEADGSRIVVRDVLSITNTNRNNMSLHMLRNLATNGVLVASSDQVVSQSSNKKAMEDKDTSTSNVDISTGKTPSRAAKRLRGVVDEDAIGIPVASNIFNNITIAGFSLRAYLASTPLSTLRVHVQGAIEVIDRANANSTTGIALFDKAEVQAAVKRIVESQYVQEQAVAVALKATK